MLGKLFALFLLSIALTAGDWPQFRGPNSSGVASDTGLPVEFGPTKNVVWKTDLPPGHSSPVLVGDHIYLTAVEGEKLLTMSLDRATGRIQWRREVPRPRKQELHKSNNPASPSPVSDGKNVYVFFTDFGMMSFGPDGNERWRLPLGPFNNPFGMGSSPVITGNTILLICDSESGSFLMAADKDTGKVKWRVERPDVGRGFSTPVLYQPAKGRMQALVAGSYRLSGYDVETGEEVWYVRGLTWQIKPTPVMAGDKVYVLGWAGGSDTGQQEDVPDFADVLSRWDTNKDGKLSKTEVDDKMRKIFGENDLDRTGFLEERDWKMFQTKRSAQNGLNAFKLGGKGDMTDKNRLWQYTKSLPNTTSPLLYDNVIYLMKEGGILTTINPEDGKVLKQARVPAAPGMYYASPVAADGKVFTVSEEGKLTVIKAGGDWEALATNDMGADVHASPAIAGGKIYVRTHTTLYCFAAQ